jgi:cytochrome c oxidase subunit III
MSSAATTRYEGRHHLAHHFDTRAQQFDSHKLAMWLFLATEVLMFGGLFCAYAIYRASHPEIFLFAHTLLDKNLGAINTIVLLFSSFTMAWAVRAAMLGQRRLLPALLAVTLVCGFGFLGIKAVEYNHKWQHGLLWGQNFDYLELRLHVAEQELPQAPAGGEHGAEVMAELDQAAAVTVAHGHDPARIPRNVHIFFGIYFVMTGLHGIHVIAGMIVIGWLLRRSLRGDFGTRNYTAVDLGGLYWHLVDLIWIFLFPLLYLIH